MGHLRNVNPLEPLVTNYRKFFGDTATIIYDVGSRDGDDAEYLRESLNASEVHCIEANPDLAPKIADKYPSFKIYQTAISNFVGTTKFQKVDHERADYVGCSSIYAEKLNNQEDLKGAVTEIEVPVTTITTILNNNHGDKTLIDLIKVDIEGYTWEFLDGLGESISLVKCFHLETEQYATHPNHRASSLIAERMHFHGFYLADKSYEWGWSIEDQVWINKSLALNNTECWS